eukprot:TRINITY_DN23411_c0_g1_i1.p1 TRINITY_DN23411_c0_g1~~TRINITY_DN23411_c0_g1_i1.p1  ORF type:complete len:437 (+),score=64.23 TRINITY_DN23411_c0_g1_i1:149-1459(+)
MLLSVLSYGCASSALCIASHHRLERVNARRIQFLETRSCFLEPFRRPGFRLKGVSGKPSPRHISMIFGAGARKAGEATVVRHGVMASAGGGSDAASSESLVLCFGEMLIDFVPSVSGVSLAEAPSFVKAPGGAPANVAVGIARLGGQAAFMGKVGEDEFGRMLAGILEKNDVNTDGLRFDEGARTALAFVTLRADGEREFMFYRHPSADMLLQPSELDEALIRKAGIVHYGSISLISEPCRSAHMALLAAAREAKDPGVPTTLLSYDPNLRMPLWPSAQVARDEIRGIWDQADIIKVSEEEITFLTEGGDPYSDEAARALLHPNLKVLLVTEGKEGCRYYTQSFFGRVGGISVEAVDATGAGDAFVAGFLHKVAKDRTILENEEELRSALEFANACGAIATTKRGAIPALPTPKEVEEAIARAKSGEQQAKVAATS